MTVSTSRLTTILASFVFVACAKSGMTQDPVAMASDAPIVMQAYVSEVFFPYQKPVDQFTQAAFVSNPNDPITLTLSYYPREVAPNMTVTVNGVTVASTSYTINSNHLILQPQPAPNAKITVTYDVENPNDVMKTNTITIPGSIDLPSLRVSLNGVLVQLSDLRLAMDAGGNYIFDPAKLLFNYDNPYNIYASRGVDVQINGNVVVSP